MKLLIPDSLEGRLLLGVSLVAAAVVYGARWFVMSIPDQSGLVCCPLSCVFPLPAAGYFVITMLYGVKPGGHAAPLIVFVLGVILALSLPLPGLGR
jgi:hypothetical protein